MTGELGSSAAGLAFILGQAEMKDEKQSQYFIERHKRPLPRVEAGLLCSGYHHVALNDISDGLASELNEIAEASRVSIDIYKEMIPVHSDLHTLNTNGKSGSFSAARILNSSVRFLMINGNVLVRNALNVMCRFIKSAASHNKGRRTCFIIMDRTAFFSKKKGYNHFK